MKNRDEQAKDFLAALTLPENWGHNVTALGLTEEKEGKLRATYFDEYRGRDLTGECGSTNEVLNLKVRILEEIMAGTMNLGEAQMRLESLTAALAWQNRY
jgi:hypothetical protein